MEVYTGVILGKTENPNVYVVKPLAWEAGDDDRVVYAQLSSPIPTSQFGSGMYSQPVEGQMCIVYSNTNLPYDIILSYINLPGAKLTGTLYQDLPESGSFYVKVSSWHKTFLELTKTGKISLKAGEHLSTLYDANTSKLSEVIANWEREGDFYKIKTDKDGFYLGSWRNQDVTGYNDINNPKFWEQNELDRAALTPTLISEPYSYNPKWEIFGGKLFNNHQWQLVTKHSKNPLFATDKNVFTWDLRGPQDSGITLQKGSLFSNLQHQYFSEIVTGTSIPYSKYIGLKQKTIINSAEFSDVKQPEKILQQNSLIYPDKGVITIQSSPWEASNNLKYQINLYEKLNNSGDYGFLHKLQNLTENQEYLVKSTNNELLYKKSYENTTDSTFWTLNITKNTFLQQFSVKNSTNTLNFEKKLNLDKFFYKIEKNSDFLEKNLNFAQKNYEKSLNFNKLVLKSSVSEIKHDINWDFGQKLQFLADQTGFLFKTEQASIKIDKNSITFQTPSVTMVISDKNVTINGKSLVLDTFLDFLSNNLANLVLCSAPGTPGPMFPAAAGEFSAKNSIPLQPNPTGYTTK